MKNKCSAFTLIELLVVISIIALLLAILLPSLRAAHEAGQAAVCMTNLDQIYKGAFMHGTDHDEHLPHYAYYASANNNSGGEWWASQVAQAIGEYVPDMYLCPSDPDPITQLAFYYSGGTISMKPNPQNSFTYMEITYRGHCDLLWDSPNGGLTTRKFTDWKRPSEAIMMLEARAKEALNYRSCFDLDDVRTLADPAIKHVRHQDFERHLTESNVLFIDGHIDGLSANAIGLLADNAEHYGNGSW